MPNNTAAWKKASQYWQKNKELNIDNMKKHLLILAMAALGLAACHSESDHVKDFIPGTYVSQGHSEYSTANDTMVIVKGTNADNIYLITRKTGFRRITDGKLQALQYQVKHLTGTWDTQKQVLQVLQTGNPLIFQPDKNSLLNGSSEYRKL
jgi:hypothetical protein